MIRIRYSSEPNGELDLEGSNQDLADLHQQIINHEQGDLVVDADDDFDPNPYAYALNRLHLVVSDSVFEIAVTDCELWIKARKNLLDLLANNLPWDAQHTNDQINYHHHFDRVWFPDLFAEDSLDLTLSLKR